MASKAAPPPPPLSRTLILPLFLWLHADCVVPVVVGNRMGDDGRVDCDCHDRHKTRSLHFRRTGTQQTRHEQHFFRLTQIARPIKFPRTMRSPITRSRRNNHVSRFAVKTSPVMMILKGDTDRLSQLKSSAFCLLPPDEDEGDERRQLPSSNPEQQQLL